MDVFRGAKDFMSRQLIGRIVKLVERLRSPNYGFVRTDNGDFYFSNYDPRRLRVGQEVVFSAVVKMVDGAERRYANDLLPLSTESDLMMRFYEIKRDAEILRRLLGVATPRLNAHVREFTESWIKLKTQTG